MALIVAKRRFAPMSGVRRRFARLRRTSYALTKTLVSRQSRDSSKKLLISALETYEGCFVLQLISWLELVILSVVRKAKLDIGT
jgi:hypothetical protein